MCLKKGVPFSIQKLKEALSQVEIEDEQKENIIQYFTDLAHADREFIMNHYRGNHESLSSFWTKGNAVAKDFNFPDVSFKERETVELGVIRELQKK